MAEWRDAHEPAVLSRCTGEGLSAFWYTSVKPEQLKAIQCVLKGEDVFVSVPTGFDVPTCFH